MSYDHTLLDMLRTHDKAVYEWLGNLKVDYGAISGTPFPSKEILRVFASPGNAFAKMRDILIRKGWIQRPTNAEQLDAAKAYHIVPLPFISIFREDPENDPSRAQVPARFGKFIYDPELGMHESHAYPGTYLITYQLDFWMLKKYTEAHILEWVQSNFGKVGSAANEMMLPVRHGTPWGMKIHGFKMLSMTDNSDLEGFEADRRYIRFTGTFMLNALMFRVPDQKTKPVLAIHMRHHDARYADGKTDDTGPLMEVASVELSVFPDDGVVASHLIHNAFDLVGTANIERSTLTSDGRQDIFRKRPRRTGRFYPYKLSYTGAGSVATRTLKLMDGKHLMAYRFHYLAPDGNLRFVVIDKDGNSVQTWDLQQTRKWLEFECFSMIEGNFGMKWVSTGDTVAHIDKVRHQLLDSRTYGGPVLPAENSIAAGNRRIVFRNLDWKRGYILSGILLNTVDDFDIVVSNDETSPDVEDRIPVIGGEWLSFAALSQAKPWESSIVVTLDGVSDDVSSIEALEYRGATKGRHVPV